MKKREKVYWGIGLGILIILTIAYFIPVTVEDGANYETVTPLLGLIIFYNARILAIYIIIALLFMFLGLKHRLSL